MVLFERVKNHFFIISLSICSMNGCVKNVSFEEIFNKVFLEYDLMYWNVLIIKDFTEDFIRILFEYFESILRVF